MTTALLLLAGVLGLIYLGAWVLATWLAHEDAKQQDEQRRVR